MGKALEAAALLRDYARLWAALPGAEESGSRTPRRVLFLGYAAVGDLIFLLPALKALRQGLPQARIVLVGDRDPGATELLPATTLVDEIWTYTHPELAQESTRREIEQRIKAEAFDAVIISQATPMRPFARAILPIPLRIGHLRPLETSTERSQQAYSKIAHAPTQVKGDWSAARYALWKLKRAAATSEFERRWVLNRPVWVSELKPSHTVIRHLKLIEALGLPVPPPAVSRPELPIPAAAADFAGRNLPQAPGQKTIGVHLGSPQSQYMKIWPAQRWGAVCRELAKKLLCRFVLIGGPAEVSELPPFRSEFHGPHIDLVGKAGLLESFAVIARCDLFLSSDTGLSKAAMALRVPTVSVWGPVSPLDVGVIWDFELHTEISLEVPCSPCVQMALRSEGPGVINFSNCGHHRCLQELTPEKVIEAIMFRHGDRLRG